MDIIVDHISARLSCIYFSQYLLRCVTEGFYFLGECPSTLLVMRLTLQALISHGRVARRIGLGPESRINLLRNILTGLVRHERLETTRARADEVRFYAEKASTKPRFKFQYLALPMSRIQSRFYRCA